MTPSPVFPDFGDLPTSDLQETAWIEVIRKMEEVYSDLIRYEVDLERKNAALEEAQQFITSVVSSISDVLIVSDPQGEVIEVNKALVDLTGLSEGELLGRPLRDLFAPDSSLPACFGEPLAELRPGGVNEVEVQLRAITGSTDPVALNCSTRFDTRGRPAGMVLIGRPVGELRRAYQALNTAHAELKQAQQQLVQAENMASLGRLVAGVAHELNNPISFVYGNVHTLTRYRDRLVSYLAAIHGGAEEGERQALRQSLKIDRVLADLGPLIDGIQEGASRVSTIVKNLRRLSFSGTETPERLDLSAVVATAARWAAQGRPRATPVECLLEPEVFVMGHAGQVHQVVVNLVENALDACAGRPDPAIWVRLEKNGAEAVIAVEDTGPGLAPDEALKIFQPFYTTKSVGQGTGLGLWISYGIVKDHGGTITAKNRVSEAGDTLGARVSFTLPLAP